MSEFDQITLILSIMMILNVIILINVIQNRYEY